MENPFASYTIEIPKQYWEQVKKYSQTAGARVTREFTPFKRQVDFWYFSFLYAHNKYLEPEQFTETVNITPASILSTDPYRILHIQLAYLGVIGKPEAIMNSREVLDHAIGMANAGIPHVLQLLSDEDQRPLWNLTDEIESMIS